MLRCKKNSVESQIRATKGNECQEYSIIRKPNGRRNAVLLIAVLVACMTTPALANGNCSSAEMLSMTHMNTEVQVQGVQVTMIPLSGGQPIPGAYIAFTMDVGVERARVSTWLNGSSDGSEPMCVHPRDDMLGSVDVTCVFGAPGACMVDPLQPYDENVACHGSVPAQSCGEILRHKFFIDLDCWTEQYTAQMMGVDVQFINVHFIDTDSNFTARATYALPSADFTYYPPVTGGVTPGFVYKYVTHNRIKKYRKAVSRLFRYSGP